MTGLKISVRIKKLEGFNSSDLKEGLSKGLRGTGYIVENVNVQNDLLTYIVGSERGFDQRQLFGGLHMTAEEMGTFTVESIKHEDI